MMRLRRIVFSIGEAPSLRTNHFIGRYFARVTPVQVSWRDEDFRMDFGLKGKTALVLAGGGGLGRAIAKSFAGEGANVAVAGIGADSIDATLGELEAIGGKTLGLIWDLADLSRDRRQYHEDRKRAWDRRHPRQQHWRATANRSSRRGPRALGEAISSDGSLRHRYHGPRASRHEGSWLGPYPDQHFFGSYLAHPQSRDLERTSPVACRMVEDAGPGGRQRRHHRQHHRARPHRNRASRCP